MVRRRVLGPQAGGSSPPLAMKPMPSASSIAESSNGRTRDFESRNGGSTPPSAVAPVAQSEGRLASDQEDVGSSPTGGQRFFMRR